MRLCLEIQLTDFTLAEAGEFLTCGQISKNLVEGYNLPKLKVVSFASTSFQNCTEMRKLYPEWC